MEENYKGVTIAYDDHVKAFTFSLEGKQYWTLTLDHARGSVDRYNAVKRLIGKTLLYFDTAYGSFRTARASGVRVWSDWKSRVASAPILTGLIDERGKAVRSLGPFWDPSWGSLAASYEEERRTERRAGKKGDQYWKELIKERIDLEDTGDMDRE